MSQPIIEVRNLSKRYQLGAIGATSLRDVIAFPKTTAARALFEGAPTHVPADDLKDLHIRLAENGEGTR